MPGILDLDRQQVITLLTLAIVMLWIFTAVMRIWTPFEAAYVLDAAMPLVIGYYFAAKTNGKKNGNGVQHELAH